MRLAKRFGLALAIALVGAWSILAIIIECGWYTWPIC
jgi:hypothetical protein